MFFDETLFRSYQDLAVHTRMDPPSRCRALLAFSNRLTTNGKARDELAKWEMAMAPKLVELPGRLLPPVKIQTSKEFTYNSNNASWDQCEWTFLVLH